MDCCVFCGAGFQIRNKGFRRSSCKLTIGDNTVIRILAEFDVKASHKDFVCNNCFTLLKDFIRLDKAITSRTGKKLRTEKVSTKKVKTLSTESVTHKSKALNAVAKSHYSTAIQHISRCKAGKDALQKYYRLQVRKEATNYASMGNEMSKKLTQETLHDFSWKKIIEDIKGNLPFLYAGLSGAITNRNNEDDLLKLTRGSYGAAVPVIGMAASMLMYRRKSRKMDYLQNICSLAMWSCGSGKKLFQHFQRLGVSKGIMGVTSCVDRLTEECDKEINDWKREVEVMLRGCTSQYSADLNAEMLEDPCLSSPMEAVSPTIEMPYSPPMDLDYTPPVIPFHLRPMDLGKSPPMESMDTDTDMPCPTHMEIVPTKMDHTYFAQDKNGSIQSSESPNPSTSSSTIPAIESSDNEEADECPSYSLVWDNVQILSTVRHQSTAKHNKMLMWALCFAAKNRINFPIAEGGSVRAQTLPLHLFLPQRDDNIEFAHRMQRIVMRVLRKNMTAFRSCNVADHILHNYSWESARKSRVVNLGVIESDPSSTAGVIHILDELHQYVPKSGNKLLKVPVHGDGLSVERMRDARAARAGAETAEGRFDGIEPVPQEFHKRALLMQDIYDELYNGSSGGDRGTLFQIKNRFNHRNVSGRVIQTFNYNADLLRFTTEAMTTMLAIEICNIEDPTDIPADIPDTPAEKTEYLEELAKTIVETVWHEVPPKDVQAVLDADDSGDEGNDFYEYCFCKEDLDDHMIRCSNESCMNGMWFHLQCVGLDDAVDAELDWWCSEDCSASNMSQFCICRSFRPTEETIKCIRGERCQGTGTYHICCVDVSDSEGLNWTCGSCKEHMRKTIKEDYVSNYSKALLFLGLKDLTEKDCVRENDGDLIIINWKLNMPNFWTKRHYKYLIIGHKLLADVNGFQNSRLRKEIVWNRTANLRGGLGHNLPLDLVNEFLNRDFKENMKRAHGRYTDKHVKRTSRFLGTLSRDLDTTFQTKISGSWTATSNVEEIDFHDDIKQFVNEYRQDKLFTFIPGREHAAFPGFTYNLRIPNPAELKKRLKRYSTKLDMSRQILPW